MAKNDIIARRDKVIAYLKAHRLRDAFSELRAMTEKIMAWEITDEINRVEEAYILMLGYVTNGVADPARAEVYDNLMADIYGILDKVVRQKLVSDDTPTLYYNTLRYEQTTRGDTISSLVAEYVKLCEDSSIYNLITSESQDANAGKETQAAKERVEKRLFNRIWVTFPLMVEDEESINNVLKSASLSMVIKELLLSALLLSLLEFYDERKLRLLMTAYEDETAQLSAKALVGILLALCMYHERIIGTKMLNRIETMKERPQWQSDVKMVYTELIRTRDTERISRKMRDEVIPQMIKLRPDIYKKINDSMAVIDLSSLEENPEWEELLKQSGITDKIKELSELQEEGGDVFMSTFSSLKSFPFFSDISNWFLPFHLEHSLVNEVLGTDTTVIGELIETAPILCNSDKYSFMLSLKSIPAQQRKMMLSQLDQHRDEMKDVGEMLTAPDERCNIINKYLQDLYRFFKLFRRKKEFNDPFNAPISLVKVPLLADELSNIETLMVAAEFYFKRKYYTDAYDAFKAVSEKTTPSASLYQKMGYCLQQNNDIEGALQHYEQAELLNADSLWTLRRIGACYRLLNKPAKALEYFQRIATANPDDLGVVMNIGHCLLQLGRYEEAVKHYYKVEFLDEQSSRAWRPLAWCLLLSKDFEHSRDYFDKILADNPTTEDYLNMGHLMLATGDYGNAIKNYRLSIESNNGNVEDFMKSMNDDKQYLSIIGIDTSILPLITDAMLYST